MRQDTSRDRWLLVGGFALLLASLRPWREFALLDDWSYAYTVKTFLDTGQVRVSDWSSPAFLLQGAWGLLFCAAGFSLAALRLSTAAAALGCVALTHRWLGALGLGRGAAALGAAALAVNPVFLNLSLTYMTDVPFLFFCLLFFNLISAEGEADPWACGLTAAAAALIRQPGALLPVGYAAYLLSRRALGRRRAFALLFPSVLALGAYEYWFVRVHGPTWAHYWYNTVGTVGRLTHPWVIAKDALPRTGWFVLYAGLSSLPLVPGGLPRPAGARRLLALAALLTAAAYQALAAFPDPEATLNTLGLGRWFALGRGFKAAGLLAHPLFWKVLGLAGLVSALIAAARLSLIERRVLPSVYAAAPLVLWLFIGMEFFDRYLLMLLPLMLLPAAAGASGKAPWVLCAALGLFSAAGEADYLNCHEAFWRAAAALEARGRRPDSIWATSEYVLWRGYQADMDRLKRERRLFDIDDSDWVRSAALRREAIVSFPGAPARPGFAKTGEEGYFSPLSLRRERLFVFERQ